MRFLLFAVAVTVLAATLSFTSCILLKPIDRQMHDKAFAFIEAYERDDFTTALSLLTKDVRSKIDQTTFSKTPGDFRGAVESLRRAGITTRNNAGENELSIFVSRLNGHEGTLTFVMVHEGTEWRIANVIEGSTPDGTVAE